MIINPSDLDQIIGNGQQEVARITEQLADNAQRINGYQTELATIHTGREARQKDLQDARSDVASKQETHNQAMAYAKQAHGTPQESSANKAVSSAKRDLSAAQKQLSQLEVKHAELEQVEQGSQNELLDQLSQTQANQQRLGDELHAAEKALAQVERQHAEQKHAAILQAYTEQERRVDELAVQLIEAKAARLDLHSDAIETLSGHPDLQQSIASRMPYDDATTRLFEATLWYLDAFMDNARDADLQVKLPSLRNAANGSHADLLSYLVIQPGEPYDFLRKKLGQNPPPTMPQLRERLQSLLEEYRSLKAKQA